MVPEMMDATERQNEASPKVLIADDDPAIVDLLADRCAQMGFSVDTAANGLQLLIKAQRSAPDVIITDINMPELDGFSACLRLLNPGGKAIDVIVITGSLDPEAVRRCESLGMFYRPKGPNFLPSIAAALRVIFPKMIELTAEPIPLPRNIEVYERPRVLLIDDDPHMQEFYYSRLDKLGVELLYASDAVSGYRLACKARPSVIVTDNSMPNGDAQYLLFRLRRTAVTANIPVIVISGRFLDVPTQQVLKREICGHPGAVHIFKKSFDTSELFLALRNSVALKNFSRGLES
jgi:CheY-like chemotaxis protein